MVNWNLKVTKDFLFLFKKLTQSGISNYNLSLRCVNSFTAAMKILVNFASVFVFCIKLTVVNLIATQNTLNPLLDMDDTLEVKKDVIFQDRLVERLNSLVQSVEQNILTVNNIFFVTKGNIYLFKFYSTDALRDAKSTICPTAKR